MMVFNLFIVNYVKTIYCSNGNIGTSSFFKTRNIYLYRLIAYYTYFNNNYNLYYILCSVRFFYFYPNKILINKLRIKKGVLLN